MLINSTLRLNTKLTERDDADDGDVIVKGKYNRSNGDKETQRGNGELSSTSSPVALSFEQKNVIHLHFHKDQTYGKKFDH